MSTKMLTKNSYYITTPIYYVNDVPHIGHSYTTIAADTISRFKRFLGEKVFFLTGTDEHGKKIETTAKSLNKLPKDLADEVVVRFQNLWKKLDITNDKFIRTTLEYHKEAVAEIFQKVYENGDIYKGEYEGWYCVPCETLYVQTAANNTCPDCGRPLELIKEESYFFRLSKYQNKLLEFYEKNPDFIIPKSRHNEIVSFVKSGLRDLSVTRINVDWGIKVPFDKKHTIYVWFDALFNYLSAIGYPNNNKYTEIWPADVHLVGKDILKFHAVYWPAFLMSLNLKLPKHIVAHGWWTVDGKKMSKSLGNVVDPNEMIEKYSRDAYRYYILKAVPFGLDGNFNEKEFVEKINSDLVNDLGNLVNRSLTMIEKYNSDIVEKNTVDGFLFNSSLETFNKINKAMEIFRFDEALGEIMNFVKLTNKYITNKQPWALRDKLELNIVLYNIYCALKFVSGMILPFMPDTAAKIYTQLGFNDDIFSKKTEFFTNWDNIQTIKINKQGVIFNRYEYKEPTLEEKRISIEQFREVDLRVAKIIQAQSIQKSNKLVKLTIDVGENEPRTIVAGIKEYFLPEALIGKNIIVVANLQKAKLMNVESNGMLLAAKDSNTLKLLTVDGDIEPGSKIS